jgi:cytoskeleton protein RodZ
MSSVASPPPDTSRVGADLSAARHRLGWDLAEVAAGLRIRLPYLEALEDGRIADLPGNAYAVGFLRTYAGVLGLDPDEMARRFRAEASTVNRKTELAFPAPVPDRGVPAGAVVLLGMVLAVCGYIGWYRISGDASHHVEPVTAVPARLAALAEPPPAGLPPSAQMVPPATAVPRAASSATPPLATPAPQASAAATPAPSQSLAPPAATAEGAPKQFAVLTPSGAAPPADYPAPATSDPKPPTAADGGRMVVRASADAWVQVRDRQGHVLLNRVLRGNETWPVPNQTNLLLTTGNAGGTAVLVDGQPTPGFGGSGVVRRDIPLDPDLIKAGRLPVQIASNPAAPAPSTARPAAQ